MSGAISTPESADIGAEPETPDTGWRDISDILQNGWTGVIKAMRRGPLVEVKVSELNSTSATSTTITNALPEIFRTTMGNTAAPINKNPNSTPDFGELLATASSNGRILRADPNIAMTNGAATLLYNSDFPFTAPPYPGTAG